MNYLQFCTIILLSGFSVMEIESLPIQSPDREVAVLLPEYFQADLPASSTNPEKSIVAPLPLTLLNVEDSIESSRDATEEYQRAARSFALGGLGGFGGKFSGLGLGFGGLGNWGLGGFHGLGLGSFKPFFGNFFG